MALASPEDLVRRAQAILTSVAAWGGVTGGKSMDVAHARGSQLEVLVVFRVPILRQESLCLWFSARRR